jgi:hypothetical protein
MERILEAIKMTLVYLVLGTFLFFCADWVVLLVKISQHGNALGSVTIHRLMTSGLKNGKTDIYPLDPLTQTCVHSIFPHQGYTPCWYLERHTEQIQSF